MDTETPLLITLIIPIAIKLNTQNPVSQHWVLRALASQQQLPGSTRKPWTGHCSRQELDLEMHRSESGSQAGQGAGSSSEAGHGQRERDPHDPPALN